MVNSNAILAAMADLDSQETPNFGWTAKKHKVDRTTLRRRFKGEQQSQGLSHLHAQGHLSFATEELLVERINTLSGRGLPPTPAFVRNLVMELSGEPVGGNWVTRFVERHDDELCSVYLESIDYARRVADNSKYFKHYFELLESTTTKYRIKVFNIYNMDEKGFLIGICNTKRRIVFKRMLAKKKLLDASQDGSREFISLLACICADGTALPPALIYAGKSHDLQDTWLEDFDHSVDMAYFASSDKGWTNEDLGVSWLEKIFLPQTEAKAGFGHRLLILDGHASHVNWRFFDLCHQNRVILGILPPHSTHRLQPLDLKIFSPLSVAYSNEIDRLIQSSGGFSTMTKRNFWILFKVAWFKALSKKNIRSAFATAGIHPFDPSIVLTLIKFSTPSPSSSDSETQEKTPGSVRAVRRHIKVIKRTQGQLTMEVDLLLRAVEKLSVKNEILDHECSGLRTALIAEKKRRKRGKKMGILNKEEPGQSVFVSPAKIAAIRAHREEEETQKAADKEEKERERENRAVEKERKAREVQERRKVRQEEAAWKKASREEAKEARKQQKEANAQIRAEDQASIERKKVAMPRAKGGAIGTVKAKERDLYQGHVRSGRIVKLPTKFRD